MVLACVGVYLTNKFQQSMILAYILVGILIGPNIAINVLGYRYNGLLTDGAVIDVLLKISLLFMFFFVGLEFSITRLKETKKGAAILAITHVSTNLFLGFALASVLGWPLYDSIFLAGVIAVSSAAVAIKTLTDLNKLNGHEVKFLLGSIIVEDFILIMMISLATMSAVYGSLDVWKAFRTSIGLVVLYAFFIVMGFLIVPIIVPRLNKWMEKNESEDIFVLVTFAIIFLAGAFAVLLGIPAAFGAFFMGMAFAETSFSRNVVKRMQGLKLGSTALFFMSFGMLISFRSEVMSYVIPMILIVIPLVFINEVFILGTIGFMIGFRPRESMTIGGCLCGRGEDALLYASVGASTQTKITQRPILTNSTLLVSFAGIYCFIMASITPVIVKKMDGLVTFMTKKVPESIKFGGSLVQATLVGPIMSVDEDGMTRSERNILLILAVFGVGLMATMLAPMPVVYLIAFNTTVIALLWLWVESGKYLTPLVTEEKFEPLHIRHLDTDWIHDYVHLMVIMPPTMMFVAVAVWSGIALAGLPVWWLAIVSVLICLGIMVNATREIYGRTMGSWAVKPSARPKPRIRPEDVAAAGKADTVPLYIFRGQGSKGKAKAADAASATGKEKAAKFKPIALENLMHGEEDDMKAEAELSLASSKTKKEAPAKAIATAKEEGPAPPAAGKGAGLKAMLHLGKRPDIAKDGDVPEEVLQMDEPPRPAPFRPPPRGVPRPPQRAPAGRMQTRARPAPSMGRAGMRAVPLARGNFRPPVRQSLAFMPSGNRYERGRPPSRRPVAYGGARRSAIRSEMASGRPMMNRPAYRRGR